MKRQIIVIDFWIYAVCQWGIASNLFEFFKLWPVTKSETFILQVNPTRLIDKITRSDKFTKPKLIFNHQRFPRHGTNFSVLFSDIIIVVVICDITLKTLKEEVLCVSAYCQQFCFRFCFFFSLCRFKFCLRWIRDKDQNTKNGGNCFYKGTNTARSSHQHIHARQLREKQDFAPNLGKNAFRY